MNFQPITKHISLLRTPFCGSWSGVVLVRAERNIIVDCGAGSDIVDGCIIPALRSVKLRPEDIHYIVLTHCHGDHIGGLRRLRELTHAKVAVYKGSVEKVKCPLDYSRRIRARFPDFSPPPPSVLDGTEADEFICDDEVVGGILRLIHTPGHDNDTVCWYDTRSQTLISGDSLQANGTVLQGLGFYQYLPAYRQTLGRLMRMDIQNLVPAHHYLPLPESAVGHKQVSYHLNKSREIIDEYNRFVRHELKSGVTDLPSIAKSLIRHIGGIEPEYLFLPLHTIEQHVIEIRNQTRGAI